MDKAQIVGTLEELLPETERVMLPDDFEDFNVIVTSLKVDPANTHSGNGVVNPQDFATYLTRHASQNPVYQQNGAVNLFYRIASVLRQIR